MNKEKVKDKRKITAAVIGMVFFAFLLAFIIYDNRGYKAPPIVLQTSSSDTSQEEIYENDNRININSASADELEEIPGIGEKTAQNIVDFRKKNGGFESVEEIKEVKGIGENVFEEIKYYLRIK